jgi:hypothetical protein
MLMAGQACLFGLSILVKEVAEIEFRGSICLYRYLKLDLLRRRLSELPH